jgi:lipopolysaccharide/colanic/teichoic acid biosynthesis glycosyltransferase
VEAAITVQTLLRETGARARRIGDIILAGVLLVVTLPLMIVVAIAIKCDSPGPILIREPRIGRHGRRCLALKFRITGGSGSQGRADVTFVGNIIHFLRIDDLPQLLNVLRGEMTCAPRDRDDLFFLD